MKIALWGVVVLFLGSLFVAAADMADTLDLSEEPEITAEAVLIPPTEQEYYYIVKYSEENIAKSQEVLQKQLHVLYYIPYHQYVVKAPEEALQELQEDGYVVDYRLFREQPGRYRSADNDDPLYYVYAFQDADIPAIKQQIQELGIPVKDVKDYILVLSLDKKQPLDTLLPQIIQIEGVEAIEPRPHYEFFNDKTNVVVGTFDVRQRLGLYGEGQIIAIADTGLDTGNVNTVHEDFKGRIVSLVDVAEDPRNICQGMGNPNDPVGHGTHVAGSALGNGVKSGSNTSTHYYPLGAYAGAAPEAKLVFQAIGCDQGGLSRPELDTGLFLPAYLSGARVHSNSYGSSIGDGSYYYIDQTADSFINQRKDMVILFAAGNDGQGTMKVATTSKNAIVVGGFSRDEPNIQWHAKGPTKDGRYKPDVLSTSIGSTTNWPGIISTKSSIQQPWPVGVCKDLSPISPYYCDMGGTSVATPNAAGLAALTREYYIKKRSTATPSAALVKATILNGAEGLGNGVPTTDYGWGRVNLTNTFVADSTVYYDLAFWDVRQGLTTNGKKMFTLYVKPRKPLRLTLVWTDKEGSCITPGCQTLPTLVNDLDLVVTDPQGNKYNGNDITVPYNDQWDRRNNVERVEIQNPVPGTYTVEVRGYNIPLGSQDFALVASYDNALVEIQPVPVVKVCWVNGQPC